MIDEGLAFGELSVFADQQSDTPVRIHVVCTVLGIALLSPLIGDLIRARYPATVPEAKVAHALARARRAGISPAQIADFFADALVVPVLTAHPTEVRRKSTIDREIEIAQLLADRDASIQVNAVGANEVEISGGGSSVRIEFDQATGLPARERYSEAGENGPTPVEERFSDWRAVDGVQVPFKTSFEQNGKTVSEVVVQNYQINTGLKAEELGRKQ